MAQNTPVERYAGIPDLELGSDFFWLRSRNQVYSADGSQRRYLINLSGTSSAS